MRKSARIFVTQYVRNSEFKCQTTGIFHVPKPVCEHEDITVLCNQGVQTDREVLENRPDITIKNK
jgi:hypothetical protein